MRAISVVDVKNNFFEIMNDVIHGEEIGILYDNVKKPVAMLVPYVENKQLERKIGILDGKINITFCDNFEITTEELIEMI